MRRDSELILARDERELRRGIEELRGYHVVAVDTETDGLDPLSNRVMLVQLGTGLVQMVVDCACVDPAPLREILEGPQVKVFHNAKFDLKMLKSRLGLSVGNVADTMLIGQVLDNSFDERASRHSLKALAEEHLDIKLDKEERKTFLEGGGITEAQIQYARMDVTATYGVFLKQLALLKKNSLEETAGLECRAVTAYADMELCGMHLDAARWAEAVAETEADYKVAKSRLLAELKGAGPGDLFGDLDANLGSDEQMRNILERVGLKVRDMRKETLLRTGHPAAELLVRFREERSLKTAHGADFPHKHIHPADGRVHADFSQIAAPSGRSSCSSPNLMGIPKTTRYRRCLNSPPGRRMITADYAGCELRIIAEASGDPIFIKTFSEGGDLHAIVAEEVFRKKVSKIENKDLRDKAKVINFGLAYGMGAQGLAAQIRTTTAEAENLLKRYFRTFPTIYNYLENSAAQALNRGYAVTLGGRRCGLPEAARLTDQRRSEAERFAKNMPIQGTNADMIKTAIAAISEAFAAAGLDARMVNMVHDEIVAEASAGDARRAAETVKEQMVKAGRRYIRKVPVEVECHMGDYWGHAGEAV